VRSFFVEKGMMPFASAYPSHMKKLCFLLVLLLFGCAPAREIASPTLTLWAETVSAADSVQVEINGAAAELDWNEYIAGVVAAEMPVTWPMEALKAQAVAARTFAAYRLAHGGTLSDSSGQCQACLSSSELQERWGDAFDRYWARAIEATEATEGLLLTHESHPIPAFYHASSNGQTEEPSAAFSGALPCLAIVSTPEDAPGKEYAFSLDELAQKLELSPSEARDLHITGYSAAGRVTEARAGEKTLSGKRLRFALGLPSTDFSVTMQEDHALFFCHGSGHGVGMSQRGARQMAENGEDYTAILAHYYPGSILENPA